MISVSRYCGANSPIPSGYPTEKPRKPSILAVRCGNFGPMPSQGMDRIPHAERALPRKFGPRNHAEMNCARLRMTWWDRASMGAKIGALLGGIGGFLVGATAFINAVVPCCTSARRLAALAALGSIVMAFSSEPSWGLSTPYNVIGKIGCPGGTKNILVGNVPINEQAPSYRLFHFYPFLGGEHSVKKRDAKHGLLGAQGRNSGLWHLGESKIKVFWQR